MLLISRVCAQRCSEYSVVLTRLKCLVLFKIQMSCMQTYANNTLLEATADELQAMRGQSSAPPPLDDGTTAELPSAKAVS